MAGQRYHVFLSHASADKPAVEELARWLVREGLTPFFDKWNLIPGEKWIPALLKALADSATCAVFFGPGEHGGWQTEEVEQALIHRVSERNRKAGDQFRTIPVLLPGAAAPGEREVSAFNFLAANTWVKFEKTIDEHEPRHRLVCGIKGIEPGDLERGAITAGDCPYRGLNVFDVEHWRLFFGREKLTHDLVEMLDTILASHGPRLLAVVGPSGSGKSSIVRAGLVPVLDKGALGNSASWRRLIFKPGQDPFENLGLALSTLPSGALLLAETRDFLAIKRFGRDDYRSLHTAARLATRTDPDGTRLLVVVDQFEEVFTQCSSEADRRALIENLLQAATVHDGPVVVVLALRADFMGACAGHRDLADAISGRQKLVGAMIEDELRWAIEKPASLAGGEVEPELVEQLLLDVGSDPTALPLLEFVLTQLWTQKTGRRMTAHDYRSIGGLRGALKQHADTVVENLKARGLEDICRRVFLDLIEPGKGTLDTRRRVDYRQVAISPEWSRVVETLIKERLLAASIPAATESGSIEIVHESLIKYWTTLQGWVDSSRKSIETRSELEDAADRWAEQKKHPDFLIGGLPLDNALAWANTFPDDLVRLARVREFLAQSEAAQKRRKEDALEIERRLRENTESARLAEQKRAEAAEAAAREQERMSQRLLATAIIASVCGIVAACLGGLAEVKRQAADQAVEHEKLATAAAQDSSEKAKAEAERANEATALAESRRLAALSDSVLPERLDLAMLLALEATRTDTLESRLSLERVHNHRPEISRFHVVPKGTITSVAYAPDGRLAAGYRRKDASGVAVFDKRLDRGSTSPLMVKEGSINSVAYGADGRLAAGYTRHDLVSAGGVVVFGPDGDRGSASPLEVKEGRVRSVAYSPDGRLAVGYTDGSALFGGGGVVVFDSLGKRMGPALWEVKEGSVTSVAFSRDGRLAVGCTSGYGVGGVVVFDARGKRAGGAPWKVTSPVNSVAYGPDGRLAAGYGWGRDGGVAILDAQGERPGPAPLEVNEGSVESVAYAADGRLAVGYASKGASGVLLFDSSGKRVGPAPLEVKEGSVTRVAFGPDGRLAVAYSSSTGGADGLVVFHTPGERSNPAPLEMSEGAVESIAYSSNGRIAAAYSSAEGDLETIGVVGRVVVFDGDGKREILAPMEMHGGDVTSLKYSLDGRLAAVHSDGRASGVYLFDASGKRSHLAPFPVKQAFARSAAFGPEGRLAVGYGALGSGGVVVFDLRGVRETSLTLEVKEGSVRSVAYGPGGRLAAGYAARGGGGGVVVFDAGGARVSTAPLLVNEGAVSSVAFAPDGRLAAGYRFSLTGGVMVFDAQGGPVSSAPWEVNEGAVTSLTFGPSARLAVGYYARLGRGGVLVFDASGDRVTPAPLEVNGMIVASVAYGPNGRLAAAYLKGVAIFDADPASWKRKVEHTVNRNFTRAEWRKYFPATPYRRTIRSASWPDDLLEDERKQSQEWEKANPEKKAAD